MEFEAISMFFLFFFVIRLGSFFRNKSSIVWGTKLWGLGRRGADQQRDRESRPNHMLCHLRSPKPLPLADLRRVARGVHSVAKQVPFNIALPSVFFGFLRGLGRFLEGKTETKIYFWGGFCRCFLRSRFGIDFDRIFGVSRVRKSIKTISFSMVFDSFCKIDVFRKYWKNGRFWSKFRRPKRRKINKNWCLKAYFFRHWFSSVFFSDFFGFGLILGGFWAPKNYKKIEKIGFGVRLEGVWDFVIAFGRNL